MAEESRSTAPIEEDERFDDYEFEPQLEPKKAKAWLNRLQESEDAFEPWNTHCDRIEKQYASLERLTATRDPEFQMFWANCEVIKPAIYFKAPQPVVVTRFKDRRPVYQAAAELLERCCTTAFDLAYINDVMLQVRDDVALIGRGVPWVRYESGKGSGYYDTEKVCIDYKHRRDFLHSVSRCWYEVTWVAAASYLTRAQARKRFKKYSGDEYQNADYKVDKDAKDVGGADSRERAKFWEIHDKANRRVVWVAEGCENILDDSDPEFDLQDFFPCPKPAYGTIQKGSLVPVPDVLQYQDQLRELNSLTARIHCIAAAIEAKGFYPSGGSDLGDAIEAAIKHNTPGRVLVPIPNWAQFGGSKEVIIWLPVAELAQTVQVLVGQRKEIIQDIYQIMGLSDIMRGATDARETLGAQQLKTQYGSTRIRDKQQEMVRIARDLVCITAEIIAEKFNPVTIIQMSQTQLPTDDMKRQQLMQLQQQVGNQQLAITKMQQMPQMQQMMQQNPEPLQQMMQQGQQLIQEGQKAIQKIQDKPTFEQVIYFLQDNRARAFTLDIQTDSTIQIDENSEKQRRSEFTGMLAQLLPQLAQMIQLEPGTADFCGEVLKFSVAPFRAGRSLDGAIDELVEQMKMKADKPRGDDPTTMQAKTAKEIEGMKISYQKEKDQGELALRVQELKQKDEHAKMKIQSDQAIEMAKMQGQRQQDEAKAQQTNLKTMADREKAQAQRIKSQDDMRLNQQKSDLAIEQSNMKRNDMLARQSERQAAQQFRQQQQAARGFPS